MQAENRLRWFGVVVAVVVSAMTLAWAAEPEGKATSGKKRPAPEWLERVHRQPPGDFPLVPASMLAYNVSWKGMLKAGETRIVFLPPRPGQGESIRTVSRSRSAGAARMLWSYDARVDSTVIHSRLVPVTVDQWEADRQEENFYRTTFSPGLIHSRWITKPKKAGEPDEDRQRTFAHEPVHDLVSAMLYLRSFPWKEKGKSVTVIVFPFRDPYLATATLLGKEKRSFGGKSVDALEFDLVLSKIEKNGDLKPMTGKVKTTRFWISDDALRLPLEMRAEVFVGDIRVVLSEFSPLPPATRLSTPAELEAVLAAAGSPAAKGEPKTWRDVLGPALIGVGGR